ncbi:MAG: hypothetical protein WCE54_03745 [Ignavibacteriaceae bacterium]
MYKAKFKVCLAGTNKVFNYLIRFQLSNLDIKSLYKNIEACKTFIEKVYINVSEELNEKWEWITVNARSETEAIRISHQKNR